MEFLEPRLEDKDTFDWALNLTSKDNLKRNAIAKTLMLPGGRKTKEPWLYAWQLLEQSWKGASQPDPYLPEAYLIEERLNGGERSADLISTIAEYIKPRLEVGTRNRFDKAPKKPKTYKDILYASITSNELDSLRSIRFENIHELDFLLDLATELEHALNEGFTIARKLGIKSSDGIWKFGGLSYAEIIEDKNTHGEADECHKGIAPTVKLLTATIKRIAELNVEEAKKLVHKFSSFGNEIYTRIWAALACKPELASGNSISNQLLSFDQLKFWDANSYPEIAVLRANRFKDFSEAEKLQILARIMKGTTSSYWRRDISKEKISAAKEYLKVKELFRIQLAGNELPDEISKWLTLHIKAHSHIQKMKDVTFEFQKRDFEDDAPEQEQLSDIEKLSGIELLEQLNTYLNKEPDNNGISYFQKARHWLDTGVNVTTVLNELSNHKSTKKHFPFLWKYLCRSLQNTINKNEISTILELIRKLHLSDLEFAMTELTDLLLTRYEEFKEDRKFLSVLLGILPMAVHVTNSKELNESGELIHSDTEILDYLNNPVGRLVSVFLRLVSDNSDAVKRLNIKDDLRGARDAFLRASGYSGVVAKYQFILQLPYFFITDEAWAKSNLITILSSSEEKPPAFWQALAQNNHFREVLQHIGKVIAEKVLDLTLSRNTRGALLSSLVLESLHSYNDKRIPEVPNITIQQVLRQVDDEIRVKGAQITSKFYKDMQIERPKFKPKSPETLFADSIKPFFENVWPKDRFLVTKGISAAFAKIPSNAGNSFSEAVKVISPFMIPFDCWSMADFGFFDIGNNDSKYDLINSSLKAESLLHLLDISIGKSEGSRFPHDLSKALAFIKRSSPKSASFLSYKRLAALTRT